MKKKMIYFGAVLSVILLFISSIGISAGEIRPDDVEYNLDIDPINVKLSNLGLSLDSTFIEYKLAVYEYVSDNFEGTELALAEQLNELDQIFIEIEGIGVTPDMTMEETLQIVGLFKGWIIVRSIIFAFHVPFPVPLSDVDVVCKDIDTDESSEETTNWFGVCIFKKLPNHHDYHIYLKGNPETQEFVYDLFFIEFVTLIYVDY